MSKITGVRISIESWLPWRWNLLVQQSIPIQSTKEWMRLDLQLTPPICLYLFSIWRTTSQTCRGVSIKEFWDKITSLKTKIGLDMSVSQLHSQWIANELWGSLKTSIDDSYHRREAIHHSFSSTQQDLQSSHIVESLHSTNPLPSHKADLTRPLEPHTQEYLQIKQPSHSNHRWSVLLPMLCLLVSITQNQW